MVIYQDCTDLFNIAYEHLGLKFGI